MNGQAPEVVRARSTARCPSSSALTHALESSWKSFLEDPWTRRAGIVCLLAVIAAVRYASGVFDPEPRPDELAYIEAFEAVARGESPYHGAYFYLPALALAGGAVVEHLSSYWALVLIRVGNLLGVSLVVWWSLAWSGIGLRGRLALAIGYVVLAEPVRYGLLWGNLSLLLTGALVWALTAWPRRPLAAGLVMGASVAIKPLAPAAVAVLGVHRPRDAELPWWDPLQRQIVAAGLATVLALLVVFVPPYLTEFLELAGGRPTVTRNVSLHRLLYCYGIEPPALALALGVTGVGMLMVRSTKLAPMRCYAWAVVVMLLATPLVWSHTLLVTLPLQVIALVVAGRRWRAVASTEEQSAKSRQARLLELVLVIGAVLAIQLSQGVGGIDDQPLWIQSLVLLPPVFAPLALAVYVALRTEPF